MTGHLEDIKWKGEGLYSDREGFNNLLVASDTNSLPFRWKAANAAEAAVTALTGKCGQI